MKITCIDKEVRKVFETGYYVIPRFQRPYSWEKDHVAEFWDDVIVENSSDYFIGSIVVFKKNDEHFGIVDGQQRLTTITMILCAIRNQYSKYDLTNLSKGVHSLIEKIDLNNTTNYILQTETSYPYFQEYIQKFSKPEINVEFTSEETALKNGFDQINNYIETEINTIKNENNLLFQEEITSKIQQKLNEIRDKVLKLKIIYIELDNEDDAYLVFETLNTRGKDLSVGDLIKNFLTKNIKTNNPNVDLPKNKWAQLKKNIEGSSDDLQVDTFLLHVWLSKYDYTTIKVLYKKVKKAIDPSKAKAFLDELLKDSQTYSIIFNPITRNWSKNEYPLFESLRSLVGFRVTQQTPMVLAIMRDFFDANLRYKFAKEGLEAIEFFHYIFTGITSQRSSGGIGTMYSNYARKLSSASQENKIIVIRELKEKMKEKIPTYDEFLANFKNLKFTNAYTKQKRIIHYTLSKFDSHFNENGVSVDYEKMTIEHLLPQNPINKQENHEDYVGSIGNLVLLNEKSNSNLENKEFLDKKSILINQSIYLDEIILSSSKWGKEEIEKRTEFLAEKCYKTIFKI